MSSAGAPRPKTWTNLDNNHVQLANIVMAALTAECVITFDLDNPDSMQRWAEGIHILTALFEDSGLQFDTFPHLDLRWARKMNEQCGDG